MSVSATLGAKSLPAVTQADLGHLTHDPDYVAKIMRKREEEALRRSKLLDPRTRTRGVNHAVLDSQMEEKRAAAEREANEEAQHARDVRLQEQVAQSLETMKAEMTRERHKAANDFSLTHLRKEHRREYDLSDPTVIKRERPTRTLNFEEDDPNLGPSSMQRFIGEVPDFAQKQKEAKAATRQWLLEQMAEKQARQDAERRADEQYDREVLMANQVRAACEQAALDDAREDKIAEAMENRDRAEMTRQRREDRLQREAAEKAAHVEGIVTSDRMKETHDYKVGYTGKLLPGDYKRLTLEEEHDVYATNARLALEKQRKMKAEAEEEAEHARQVAMGVSVLGALEEERKRQSRERQQRMVDHNLTQASTKRELDVKERRTYRSFEFEP